MSLADPKFQSQDGFETLERGVDAGRVASAIAQNQVSDARNAKFRGGIVATRPGIRKISLQFPQETYYDPDGHLKTGVTGDEDIGTSDAFQIGRIQTASFYQPPGADGCLMAGVGGRLFRINIRFNTAEVVEVTPTDRNPTRPKLAYMAQADRFHITQDGNSMPMIYDGSGIARRATHGEVPPGTVMAYGMGRLTVVSGPYISFGDIYGTDLNDPGSSILQFSENNFLNEGGPAILPSPLGDPTAMIFLPQQDSSTGNGELLVFAENGVASFYLSIPRDKWKDSAFQRVALLNIGARGHMGRTSINGDIWFRSVDGYRLYRQARAEIVGWPQVPLSTEITPYIETDTVWLLKYGSAIHFDKRLIGTSSPVPNQGRVYHRGVTALDFDIVSSFGQASAPAWDGYWEGPRITFMVDGVFNDIPRAFAFGLDDDGLNCLYEISADDTQDFNGKIPVSITTRALSKNSSVTENKIYGGDFWVNDIQEDIDMNVFYKPDDYPEFIPWENYSFTPLDGGSSGFVQNTDRPAFQPRKTLQKVERVIDNDTRRETQRFYQLRVKFDWVGHMAFQRFRLKGHDEPENTRSTNP